MELDQPVHSDKHRISILQWINSLLAIGIIVVGAILQDFIMPLLGLALGLIAWFTTVRGYDIYHDRLVVKYGKPRRTVVPLSTVSDAEVLSVPVGGERLFLRRQSGRSLVLSPRDVRTFLAELENALISISD
jgi:hypothetical protein